MERRWGQGAGGSPWQQPPAVQVPWRPRERGRGGSLVRDVCGTGGTGRKRTPLGLEGLGKVREGAVFVAEGDFLGGRITGQKWREEEPGR